MGVFDNKVALITGAGGMKGVGRAIALQLGRQGATVALSDVHLSAENRPTGEIRSGWGGIESVAEEVRAAGGEAFCFPCDLSDRDEIASLVDAVSNTCGRIDILVNNARAIVGRDRVPITKLDYEVWDHFMTLNATAPFILTKLVAQKMIEARQGGRIINVGSDMSKQAAKNGAAYAASKFALIGLTQGSALDLAEYNITVNAVCPGPVNTDRLSYAERAAAEAAGVPIDVFRARIMEAAARNIPLGRVAESEDVAHLAVFLATPEAGFITGQAYNVNGGQIFH